MLTRQGAELNPRDPGVPKIKRDLTVAPIDRSGIQKFPKTFPVWWTAPSGNIVVPRFYAYPENSTVDVEVSPIDVDFCGTLKPELEQPQATTNVMTSLRKSGGAILSLGTGQGKTTCACWVIAQLRVKTIVLVHKDVLRTQWAERIRQFLPRAKVSFIQGPVCDTSGDIVIAMLQTLAHKSVDPSGFGFVVFDECHHAPAESFSSAMRGLCCPYSLGLSATPTRKDGLTKIMHWFLGPQAYVSQRKNMTQVTVELIKYTCPRYRLPPPMTRFGTINHAAVLTDMAEDPTRTQMIIDCVATIRANDPTRVILILSHRRDHCLEFSKKIPEAVAFLGGAKRKKTAEHVTAPVVCATYALASEGYDDPRLNTLVLATPCSDVTQAAGRILRGTANHGMIVDILDDFSVAYAQAAKRKSYYAKAGFTYASQVRKEYPKCLIID